MCLISDLLRRKSGFCPLLFYFLHVFINQNFNIHLVQMTVNKNLLDASYNSTGNPVNTKTYRECEAEKCWHKRHYHVHGLHGTCHGICAIIILSSLRHQLQVQHLSSPGKNRDKKRCDCKKNGSACNNCCDIVPWHICNVQPQKALHVGNLRCSTVNRIRKSCKLAHIAQFIPLCRRKSIQKVNDRIWGCGFSLKNQTNTGHFIISDKVLKDIRISADTDNLRSNSVKNTFYTAYIGRNILDYVPQRPQDRQLDQKLNTASCRGYSIFLVNCWGFFLHFLHGNLIFFILIFFLDLHQLRLHNWTQFWELLLLDLKRSHKKIDQNTENNDTKTEILDSEQSVKEFVDTVHNPAHNNRDLANDRRRVLCS